MKIRSGFVSNSSSSSFVLIANKTDVNKVLEGYTPDEREVIEYIKSEHEFNGVPICIFQGVQGNTDSLWGVDFNIEFDEDGNGWEGPWDIIDDFRSKLAKQTKNVIKLTADV